MFNGTIDVLIKSKNTVEEIHKSIEENSYFIGDADVSESGIIIASSIKFNGFGFSPEINGAINKKGDNKYFVNLTHKTNINFMVWLLAICFFPIGLLAFLPAYNANQEMSTKCGQMLNEVKHSMSSEE